MCCDCRAFEKWREGSVGQRDFCQLVALKNVWLLYLGWRMSDTGTTFMGAFTADAKDSTLLYQGPLLCECF